MSHPIAVKMAKTDEYLTRGTDVLFRLNILKMLKISKRTVFHHDKRLEFFFKIYDLHNVGLSNN